MTRKKSSARSDGDAGDDGVGRTDGPARPAAAPLTVPLGQGPALLRRVRAARALRLPQALVVSGAPGSGSSTVARYLAGALLCPSDLDADGPCGLCRTCRRVQSGMHPDLHLLSPEPEKRLIAVEAVRQLREVLQRLPVEGRARVVVVDPASALQEEGQNALLKTLEEPGADTFLLLATARPEALLPTVRSRCERLGVRRLADAAIAAELSRRIPQAAARHAAAVASARGSLGRALQACTEQAVQLQDLVQQLVAGSSPLRAVAIARAVLAADDDGGDQGQRARAFLAALRAAAGVRLRALASGAAGSYVPRPSDPWTALLELALCAEQDLDLQIPAEQALVGLLLAWQHCRESSERGAGA